MATKHDDPASPDRETTIDVGRVARLREAIAAGDYAVDAETIADRLVERGFPGDVNPS